MRIILNWRELAKCFFGDCLLRSLNLTTLLFVEVREVQNGVLDADWGLWEVLLDTRVCGWQFLIEEAAGI